MFIAILIISALLYWPGLSGPFLLDDHNNLPKSFIHTFSLDEFFAASFANTSGHLKRPVAAFSFALSHAMGGASPQAFKLHNLLLHGAIGLLIFLTVRRFFYSLSTADNHNLGALLCAALWLVHPLQVSTVLYPVQRMAQLSALFTLLAIYCYCRARQSSQHTTILLFFAVPLCAVLATLSKENGALTPVFILLIESCLFKFKQANRQLKVFWLTLLVTPLFAGAIYLIAHSSLLNYGSRDFSMIDRLRTELIVLNDYLTMIVTADIQKMGIFHDDVMIARHWQKDVLAALVLHATLITIGIISWSKRPLYCLAIGWFYCAHLLESTIFPLELMFEHRNYLALLGPILLMVGLALELKQVTLSIAAVSLWLLLQALGCYERASIWGASESLYRHNLSNHPLSARAHIAYANEILRQPQTPANIEVAAKLLTQAARLNPADAGPLLHIVYLSCFTPIKFSDAFYPQLTAHYQQHALTAYGQQGLHQISKRYVNGGCDTLNHKDFIQVLDQISGHQPWRTAEMLLIKARLNSRDDNELSDALYQQSYHLSQKPSTLEELATVLIRLDKTPQAMRVVEQLLVKKSQYSPTTLRDLKPLFEWHQQQLKQADRP